jgi:NO-binding membrane sensor protein with MHYT domain
MKTLALSFVVALGTLIAMAVVGFVFFTGGGVIFPAIVAWVAASVFALERRPRHAWLHVAAIGVLVAALLNLYFFAMPRLFPPPPGYMPGGGPNVYPPTEQSPPPPR